MAAAKATAITAIKETGAKANTQLKNQKIRMQSKLLPILVRKI
ncbi:hypothetical protein SDC49_22005 [Lactobacillus sp. R2/2]|nr:hypothetical protein [Lactobacillus sp. R2/2]